MKEPFLKKICVCLCGVLIFTSLAIADFSLNDSVSVKATGTNEAENVVKTDNDEGTSKISSENIDISETAGETEQIRPSVVVAGEIEPVHAKLHDYYYELDISDENQDTVFNYCYQYDVPAELVFAIMIVESGCNSEAISDTGDYGIMQINNINRKWLTEQLGITDFLDFEQNVHCGVYMLSEYYHKYADINRIAMCYNLGENGAIERWGQGITSTEYTQSVVCAMATLKKR